MKELYQTAANQLGLASIAKRMLAICVRASSAVRKRVPIQRTSHIFPSGMDNFFCC